MPNDLSPTRGFSFRDHARSKPNMPLPGDRLDTELDRIYQAFSAIETFLGVSLDGDGKLRGSTVSDRNLAGDLFASLSQQVTRDANALLSTIQASENATQSFLTQARNVLSEAEIARDSARQAQSVAETALMQAQSAATDAARSRSTTTTALSTLSARSQDALDAANSARLSEDMAFRWAEKLDGPVFVAGGGNPVDDGYYSARFWAERTRISAEQGSFYYLGASISPPTQANDGTALLPGMWYFDLDNGQTFIWNGNVWEPITGAVGTVASVFGRVGAVQARETDYDAFYPLKAPTEAHIADTDNPHGVTYAQLLGKPSAFPTNWATITGKPTQFPTDWSLISSVPGTFPPAAHIHTESQITNLDKYTQSQVDGFITGLQNDKVAKAGDTMTGPLTVDGDHLGKIRLIGRSSDEMVALDWYKADGTTRNGTIQFRPPGLPHTNGSVHFSLFNDAGTSLETVARLLGRDLSDDSTLAIQTRERADMRYLQLAGGTLTGTLTVKDVLETVQAPVGASASLDIADGTMVDWQTAGAKTLTGLTLPIGGSMTLNLATGDVDWGPYVSFWIGGSPPDLSGPEAHVVVLYNITGSVVGAYVGAIP